MEKKASLTAVCLAGCLALSAGTVLFETDFSGNAPTVGWCDQANAYNRDGVAVNPNGKPLKHAWIAESGGETFLKTTDAIVGITHPLGERPIKVGSGAGKLTMEIVFRQRPEKNANVNTFAFTSRNSPGLDYGGPFWKGRDSGVSASGFMHDLLEANSLRWRKNGTDVVLYNGVPPYSMVPGVGKWIRAVLVFDMDKKTATFASDGRAPVEMHGIELDGVDLNSFYLNCSGNEYKSVKVTQE